VPWSAPFDDPITLPDSRTLRALRDAARIGIMRALNRRQVKPTSAPRKKAAKAYRIVR
jgi:hypothetical protein